MKLVVEIPEEQYKRIVKAPRCVDFNEAIEDRTILLKAIRKATPLDSVKAEIIKAYDDVTMYSCDEQVSRFASIVCGILNSIDNTESEDGK